MMHVTEGDHRVQVYDPNAARRAVNLSLNGDMVSRARAAHLNLSAIAEAAIASALNDVMLKRFHDEIARGVELHDAYLAEYGSLADAIRAADEADAK